MPHVSQEGNNVVTHFMINVSKIFQIRAVQEYQTQITHYLPEAILATGILLISHVLGALLAAYNVERDTTAPVSQERRS